MISTEQLSARDFGRELLRTLDLDPVYVMLHNAKLPWAQFCRFLVAYWCLYDVGSAARIADAQTVKRFWQLLKIAAENADRSWHRGSERRHWRAQNAVNSVENLETYNDNATDVVLRYLGNPVDRKFADVAGRVQRTTGFGPWIAFKVADMLERTGHAVDFSDCALSFYDSPRRGAALYLTGNEESLISAEDVSFAVNKLRVEIGARRKAPPRDDRPINIQEIETVLCKWKSYKHGHYFVGKDIKEVRHALVRVKGNCDLAQQLLKHAPSEESL